MSSEFERFLAERRKRGASNPNLFERVRELREKRLAARTDYEKAVDVLKAHSGYAETKQRIFRLFDREGIKDKEGILNRLIQEGKISYDAKLREFPYSVHLVVAKDKEEEEEGGSGGSSNPVGKLRKLTSAEIERFASRPNVRRIAVENFLMTVTNNPDFQSAIANMQRDAYLYGWNRETRRAIQAGIELSAGRGSSNPIAGLGRAEVERILRQEGWKPTLAAPRNVIDYQKGGNRVLLYSDDVAKITMKQLRYLMDTPIERRTLVWWQIEGSSNPNAEPLKIGQSILGSEHTIGISLGASWTYGLYHDWTADAWYLTDKNVVINVFPDTSDGRVKAFKAFYEKAPPGTIPKSGSSNPDRITSELTPAERELDSKLRDLADDERKAYESYARLSKLAYDAKFTAIGNDLAGISLNEWEHEQTVRRLIAEVRRGRY